MPGILVGITLQAILIPSMAYLGYRHDRAQAVQNEYYQGYSDAFVLLLPGVFQFLYMLPTLWIATLIGTRKGFKQGLVLSTVLLFLLNVGFCGVVPLLN